MRIGRTLAISVVLSGLALASAWAGPATAPVATASVDRDFSLDEYSATLSGASDFWQSGLGLTFGDSLEKKWYLFGGGRLTWVQAGDNGRTSNGWSLGAIGGVGYRPRNKFSPIGTLAADKFFAVDMYDGQLVLSGGVRILIDPRSDPQQALSVVVFGGRLYGSSGFEDRNNTGVSVIYSLAFVQQR